MKTNATYTNRFLEPGWPILRDDVPLGKRYYLYLNTICFEEVYNKASGETRIVETVEVEPGGRLPLAAFKVDES